jgi:small subunit ribosomal protein S21
MLLVYVRDADLNGALRLFKKKVDKAGINRELRRRRHYEKPSERRRRQKREGIRNSRKRAVVSER